MKCRGALPTRRKRHDDKDNLIDHMRSIAATPECFFLPKTTAKLASAMGLLLWPASYSDESRAGHECQNPGWYGGHCC